MVGMLTVLNSTIGSSLPSGAISFIAEEFHVTSSQQLVLPISLFLVGYVLGPILCGPLSETYGRKVVLVTTFILYNAATLGCALSPNWVALLIFRLLSGMGASAPISTVNGLFADIYNDPTTRGRVTAVFMAVSDLSEPFLTAAEVLMFVVHDLRSYNWAPDIWLRLPDQLEVDLLDRSHCGLSHPSFGCINAGKFRSYDFEAQGS